MNFLWVAVMAATIGSFLACAAVRLPRRQGLGGRSCCPYCGHRLTPRELIPILSWLWQRGRCRACHHPLSPLYPIVEAGAVVIALAGFTWLNGAARWAAIGGGWASLFVVALALPNRLKREVASPDSHGKRRGWLAAHLSPGRRRLRRHWMIGAPPLLLIAAGFGQTPGEILLLALLGPTLLALLLYDLRYLILPDTLVALVLAFGLSGSAAGLAIAPPLNEAGLGVLVAGATLWAVRALYARWRGVVGLGWGDVKLFAACGAWVGLQGLPDLLLIGCLVSLGGLGATRLRRGWRNIRVPFGPGLAMALYVLVLTR